MERIAPGQTSATNLQLKIACISTSQVPSNTANSIQVMKVCQAMQQLGHSIRLWVPGNNKVLPEEALSAYGMTESFDIEWIPSHPIFKRYDFAWRAVNQAVRWQADIIYTWTPQAAVMASDGHRPVILEVHDRATGKIGPMLLRNYLRPSRTDTNLLVTITHALKHALEMQISRPIENTQVVIAPNGVDLNRYTDLPNPAQARKLLSLPEQMTASYTGHFYAGRGMDILFDLARAFPHLQFLWVGGREQELVPVRQRLQTSAITNVLLTGFIDNRQLPLYQAASEILLMPYERSIAGSSGGNSADICSPMKMFEYMAAGRTILSSDLPVIREVLDDESAYFCIPENAESWIDTLKKVIQNPIDAASKAENAHDKMPAYNILARQKKILDKVSIK